MGIHGYISESRSKGFHITVYAETKFIAKDIRQVLAAVIAKLRIKTNDGRALEIFPKQNILDRKTLKYGNYINLPCFGFERPYLDDNQKDMRLAVALSLISTETSSPLICKMAYWMYAHVN